jgi:hypothetical protein
MQPIEIHIFMIDHYLVSVGFAIISLALLAKVAAWLWHLIPLNG